VIKFLPGPLRADAKRASCQIGQQAFLMVIDGIIFILGMATGAGILFGFAYLGRELIDDWERRRGCT
jgi:hypothetical protein